ncbi:MAG: cell wall hydrolase [bacterium]
MKESVNIIFLALLIWREARGESVGVKIAVAWVVRNRVNKPAWWGRSWMGVIFKPWQFSGLTATGDPNLSKWPHETEPAWLDSLEAAERVYNGTVDDPTNDATYYHDHSITKPTSWGNTIRPTVKIGKIQFYRG